MVQLINKIISKSRCELKKIFLNIIYGKNIKLGKKVYFLDGFKVVIEGGKLNLGDGCFFNRNCSINCLSNITVGDYTLFGEGVKIYDHNHRFRDKSKIIRDQGFSKKPIKIGSNCWFGSNVTILQGVTIGDNVIVGANTLIYKDIPSNKIVKCAQDLQIDEL